MEIAKFLDLNTRRIATLGIAALLSGAAAGLVVLSRPAQYEATATVFVGQALGPGRGSFELDPMIADFIAALNLPKVAKATAKATGASSSAIESGLKATIGTAQTAPVTVTFRSSKQSAADAVARVASENTLAVVAGQQVARARITEKTEQHALDAVNNEFADFIGRNNAVDIDSVYTAQSTQVADLATAVANGTAPQSQLDAKKSELTKTAAIKNQSDGFKARIARSQQALGDAQQATTDALSGVAAAKAPQLVVGGGTAKIGRLPQVVRGAVTAIVVVGAIGLLVLVVMGRRRRYEFAQVEPVETTEVEPPDTRVSLLP